MVHNHSGFGAAFSVLADAAYHQTTAVFWGIWLSHSVAVMFWSKTSGTNRLARKNDY
jgi:hypothetical protein